MEIKKDINTEYNVIAGFWKVVSNNYCGNGKYELIVNGWKNKASSTGKFLPLNLNKQMKNMFVSFVFLLFCSNVFAFNFDWDNFGSQSIFYRFSEHLTSSSDDSPVLTSTITLTPSGSGTTGYIPGSVGGDIYSGGFASGQTMLFYVAHTGSLTVTATFSYIMDLTITASYRLSSDGEWVTLDTEYSEYGENVPVGGEIAGIEGYAEVRFVVSGVGEAGSVSSYVFVP